MGYDDDDAAQSVEDYKKKSDVKRKADAARRKQQTGGGNNSNGATSSAVPSSGEMNSGVEEVMIQKTKTVTSVDIYNEKELRRALDVSRVPKKMLKKLLPMEVPTLSSDGALETVYAFRHVPGCGARRLDVETTIAIVKSRRKLHNEKYKGQLEDVYKRVVEKTDGINEASFEAVQQGELDSFDEWIAENGQKPKDDVEENQDDLEPVGSVAGVAAPDILALADCSPSNPLRQQPRRGLAFVDQSPGKLTAGGSDDGISSFAGKRA